MKAWEGKKHCAKSVTFVECHNYIVTPMVHNCVMRKKITWLADHSDVKELEMNDVIIRVK